MTTYVLIAVASIAVFYVALILWGKRQVKKCGDIPVALKASFAESNEDKSWRLR